MTDYDDLPKCRQCDMPVMAVERFCSQMCREQWVAEGIADCEHDEHRDELTEAILGGDL